MKKLFLLLLLVCAHAFPAKAAPYIVQGVTVDVTADSVVAARNQAIIEGQRKAFMNLATQLVPGQPIPNVSDTQIGNMISDFRIEREQFGAKRYVGIFTFRFRENPVRGVFGAAAIPSPQELAARAPVVITSQTTTVTTTTTAPVTDTLLPVIDDAAALINSEAAQLAPITVAENPLPPGVDINSPIKMMLIETPDKNAATLQTAADKLRAAPGVIDLIYTSSNTVVRMAYRGDTAQLVNDLRTRGVSLQQKLPTQPPIYTLLP